MIIAAASLARKTTAPMMSSNTAGRSNLILLSIQARRAGSAKVLRKRTHSAARPWPTLLRPVESGKTGRDEGDRNAERDLVYRLQAHPNRRAVREVFIISCPSIPRRVALILLWSIEPGQFEILRRHLREHHA